MSGVGWGYCGKCRSHHVDGQHAPEWDVHHADSHGDDFGEFDTVTARDAEEAVERWAEDVDINLFDYAIVGGQEATVFVRQHDTLGAWQKWVVTGEAVPSYNAWLAKAEGS